MSGSATAGCCSCVPIRARRRRWCLTRTTERSRCSRAPCGRGIYDNMKTAVETVFVGKDRLYNRHFLQMRSHYLVDPVACELNLMFVHSLACRSTPFSGIAAVSRSSKRGRRSLKTCAGTWGCRPARTRLETPSPSHRRLRPSTTVFLPSFFTVVLTVRV